MKNFLKTIAINATAVILVVGIVIFANYIAGRFSARLDLTEDKVYSLAEATQKILDRLREGLLDQHLLLLLDRRRLVGSTDIAHSFVHNLDEIGAHLPAVA